MIFSDRKRLHMAKTKNITRYSKNQVAGMVWEFLGLK
jgi:hypothetical protein